MGIKNTKETQLSTRFSLRHGENNLIFLTAVGYRNAPVRLLTGAGSLMVQLALIRWSRQWSEEAISPHWIPFFGDLPESFQTDGGNGLITLRIRIVE